MLHHRRGRATASVSATNGVPPLLSVPVVDRGSSGGGRGHGHLPPHAIGPFAKPVVAHRGPRQLDRAAAQSTAPATAASSHGPVTSATAAKRRAIFAGATAHDAAAPRGEQHAGNECGAHEPPVHAARDASTAGSTSSTRRRQHSAR